MKLSQMTNDQAADAIVLMSEPASRIMDDPALTETLQKISEMSKDTPVIRIVSVVLSKLLPTLLKTHREDTYLIVSAMTGKTVEDVAGQMFLTTLNDCRDFIDKDLIDFFRSSGAAPRSKGKD